MQEAVYSGGNTTLYLADAICYAGMSALGYVSPVINPTNLCAGGTPLSGGDLGSWAKGNAFDGLTLASNNYLRVWLSSQQGNAISGNARIGCQLTASAAIRWVKILQSNGALNSGDGGAAITSALLQYSSTGLAGSWTTQATLTLLPELYQTIIIPEHSNSYAYWSLLANANPAFTAGYWGVNELQMGV